jgi:hypothetical protein
MKKDTAMIAGWVSGGLLLLAYALLTCHVLSELSPLFHILCLAAAFGFIYVGWKSRALWMIALNVCWCLIGIHTLIVR